MSHKLRNFIIANLVGIAFMYLAVLYFIGGTSFDLEIYLLIFILPILSVLQIITVKIRFPHLKKIESLLPGYEMEFSIPCRSDLLKDLCQILKKDMKVLTCNDNHLLLSELTLVAWRQQIDIRLTESDDGNCLINVNSYNKRIFWKSFEILDFGVNYKNCLMVKRLISNYK